ncbi:MULTISPECIES: Rrf2 family transcriptional regulator [unclassified Pseudoalteromonas]|uniref:Rrf2 family transcriptional regulator n=1 Tax=unclassified Pseudoalteromonas TaxID=194690 RepID=UPI000CF66349|nr:MULTISPECIES: Rrf2 family transcriptional regulator [unclassified Pseudoalteromonas]MBS3799170.1 Rrf2 family transcriptional regulator [Pseudoalteromonas sp. BDTF-M6]
MNITRFTDYSLRVLIYTALHDGQTVTIKAVAEKYDISKNHLMKVVQELSNKGYLIATRGKNGGIRLGREPSLINVGEIVRLHEQNSVLVECFGSDNQCVITPACKLKTILSKAMEQFFAHLDQYSLADLVNSDSQSELKQLLQVSEPSTF